MSDDEMDDTRLAALPLRRRTVYVYDKLTSIAYADGVAAGREQAAKVCDARSKKYAADPRRRQWDGMGIETARIEAQACATAIRASAPAAEPVTP